MGTSNLSRDKILNQSEQGFLVFLKFFPSLIVQRKYGIQVELNSPFRNCPGTLSIYFNEDRGKWFFGMGKDSKIYGDIFGFIARLYKLDYKRDFAKIIKIIEREMNGFDPSVLECSKRIQVGDGEWLEVEAGISTSNIYEKYFGTNGKVSFPLLAVTRFKSSDYKKIIAPDGQFQYFAVEAIPDSLYYVFDTIEFSCSIIGQMGYNYFFGLEQAIKINFFLSPTSKPNLLLCADPTEVLIFNYVGVPAIHVRYESILEHPYFEHIVAATFPNLIATTPQIPKQLKKKFKIKLFDVQEYLAGYGLDLRNHCLVEQSSDDFLEPLWNLYKYIDNDELNYL